MCHANLELIDRFFAAYGNHDLRASGRAGRAHYVALFRPPRLERYAGLDGLMTCFDAMGRVQEDAQLTVEQLVLGVHDQDVVACQQIRTGRADGPNLDQQPCVRWCFVNGMIASGCYLAAEEEALDAFSAALPPRRPEGT